MPGRKKSRKVGKIGVSKSEVVKVVKKERKPKKTTGKAAGSRNNVLNKKQSVSKSSLSDPRLGSTKPIDLQKYSAQQNEAPQRFFSPQQELDSIENDQRLHALLDKAERAKLSKHEQDYVNSKVSRHNELCVMLGIETQSEDDDIDSDNTEDVGQVDPMTTFDSIKIQDYKD